MEYDPPSRRPTSIPAPTPVKHVPIEELMDWVRVCLAKLPDRLRTLFTLRVHLMMCGLCRHLTAQFNALRRLVKTTCHHDHEHEEHSSECLPEEAKARILECLKNTKPKP